MSGFLGSAAERLVAGGGGATSDCRCSRLDPRWTSVPEPRFSRREKYCPNEGMAFAHITAAATEIADKWRGTEGSAWHHGPQL
jgi:hypothetical protein